MLVAFAFGGAMPSSAQQFHKTSSGTGFFVSRKGELVTNAHVVDACLEYNEIFFTGPNKHPRRATLIAIDRENDLALLRTGYRPNRVAKLRWSHVRVSERERVFVIGYPEPKSINSPYVTRTAMIKKVHGPLGEEEWFQFTDSVRPGNSGGPLLDFAGNVLGVVTAKIRDVRMNRISARKELISKSDIAVSVYELKKFLDRHYVHFQQDDAVLILKASQLEKQARDYVVHIFCRV